MREATGPPVAPTLRSYLAVVSRRWTVMVPAIVLVPLLAIVLALHQRKEYSAQAQVLISGTNVGAMLNGLVNRTGPTPVETVTTEAALAREPAVAQLALSLARSHASAKDLLAHSSVSTFPNADLLAFSVRDGSPGRAVRLATDYARAYTIYRQQVDNAAVGAAIAGVERRLSRFQPAQHGLAIYRALAHERQVLTATQAAMTSDAQLVQPAETAAQVSRGVARNAAIGLVLGLVLAVGLAALAEALSTQVEALAEVENHLGLPLLARVPGTRWENSSTPDRDSLAMVRDPYGPESEALRALRSNLGLMRVQHHLRSILMTSGCDYPRKPTISANLALTLAQAGQRVLLCDLDIRRRAISHIFELDGHPGLADVVLGESTLEEAIVPMAEPPSDTGGRLEILPFGSVVVPNPDLLGSRAVAELITELGHAPADIVLFEAPPLLSHGDTMALCAGVDSLILSLAAPVPGDVLADLARILPGLPTRTLGFISVGAFSDGARFDLRRTPPVEGELTQRNGHSAHIPVTHEALPVGGSDMGAARRARRRPVARRS